MDDVINKLGLSRKQRKQLKKIVQVVNKSSNGEISDTTVATVHFTSSNGKKFMLVEDIESTTNSRRPNSMIPYSTIGGLNSKETQKEPLIDVFDLLTLVPRSAFIIFNEAKTNRDPYTNETWVTPPAFYTANQKRIFTRNLGKLVALNILIKIKSRVGVYMLNPNYIKPMVNNESPALSGYDFSVAVWNQLKVDYALGSNH